uniref:Uncharacterized protein n=1 Tax=Anguilla anguilla TaxID=7936 RepID=A0A0E9UU77_ANGAN
MLRSIPHAGDSQSLMCLTCGLVSPVRTEMGDTVGLITQQVGWV